MTENTETNDNLTPDEIQEKIENLITEDTFDDGTVRVSMNMFKALYRKTHGNFYKGTADRKKVAAARTKRAITKGTHKPARKLSTKDKIERGILIDVRNELGGRELYSRADFHRLFEVTPEALADAKERSNA